MGSLAHVNHAFDRWFTARLRCRPELLAALQQSAAALQTAHNTLIAHGLINAARELVGSLHSAELALAKAEGA
jgi:hypothetical protein